MRVMSSSSPRSSARWAHCPCPPAPMCDMATLRFAPGALDAPMRWIYETYGGAWTDEPQDQAYGELSELETEIRTKYEEGLMVWPCTVWCDVAHTRRPSVHWRSDSRPCSALCKEYRVFITLAASSWFIELNIQP